MNDSIQLEGVYNITVYDGKTKEIKHNAIVKNALNPFFFSIDNFYNMITSGPTVVSLSGTVTNGKLNTVVLMGESIDFNDLYGRDRTVKLFLTSHNIEAYNSDPNLPSNITLSYYDYDLKNRRMDILTKDRKNGNIWYSGDDYLIYNIKDIIKCEKNFTIKTLSTGHAWNNYYIPISLAKLPNDGISVIAGDVVVVHYQLAMKPNVKLPFTNQKTVIINGKQHVETTTIEVHKPSKPELYHNFLHGIAEASLVIKRSTDSFKQRLISNGSFYEWDKEITPEGKLKFTRYFPIDYIKTGDEVHSIVYNHLGCLFTKTYDPPLVKEENKLIGYSLEIGFKI